MKKNIFLLIPLLVLLLLLAATPFAPAVVIDWYAVGPGGVILTENNVDLYSVVGQGIAGQISYADSEICSGYLCMFTRLLHWIYLPLIVR